MSDYDPFVLRLAGSQVCLELVPAFGGRINRLILSDHFDQNLIAGLYTKQALSADERFRGVPLFPFPNRLENGRFTLNNQVYQFPVNEPSTGSALHGFLYQVKPEVIDHSTSNQVAQVTLRYLYEGSLDGYPFPCQVDMNYELQAGSLQLVMKITNTGEQSMPVGLGWHPYFQLDAPVDDLSLQLPEVAQICVDKRGIPTGERAPFKRFEQLESIADIQLDTGFVIHCSNAVATTSLWSEKQQHGLEIWQQTGTDGLNYLQVFTPPGRESIAIEPMSCSINAFNTGDGLRTIPPGDSTSGMFGVRLISQNPQ